MDLRLSDEQRELQALARRVATDAAASGSLDPLVRAGLAGLLVAETEGGAGGSLVDGVLVAEELGRSLAPGFVASSVLIAPHGLDLLADREERRHVAAHLAEGRPACTVVGRDLSWPPRRSALAWGWHADALVLAPTVTGMAIVDGTGLEGRPTEDGGLLVADVELPLDPEIRVTNATLGFVARVNVLLAGLLVGHMAAALDLAVEHAKNREQFGVKIGSFQAIKHLCADMLVNVESSRSALYGCAVTVEEGNDSHEAARAGAVAKSWCADAAVATVETAVQVFGGMGYTWECPVHRYLRAAHVVRASFLGPVAALDLVAGSTRWS